MPPTLSDALGVDGDSVFVAVGAGGKKTLIYALADELSDAVVTATVKMPKFGGHVERTVLTDDPVSAAREATERPLGLARDGDRSDRYLGYDPEVVDDLAASGATPLLVKGDGARTRLLKAPKEGEPPIPNAATVVAPLASVRVVGQPLTEEAVHRPKRVAELTDVAAGNEIRPKHVADVLAHPDGGLKNVPDGADAVPVVNMADTEETVETAREIAAGVLERARSVPRVLVTRLIHDDPVVDVLERD
ncbi:selenium cofactor biosynthesis protein YqeC [Halogeometricum pallidum]|nr:selenium cofactor biosynthesis protein YqeC [Halogeometricum pallidum]